MRFILHDSYEATPLNKEVEEEVEMEAMIDDLLDKIDLYDFLTTTELMTSK